VPLALDGITLQSAGMQSSVQAQSITGSRSCGNAVAGTTVVFRRVVEIRAHRPSVREGADARARGRPKRRPRRVENRGRSSTSVHTVSSAMQSPLRAPASWSRATAVPSAASTPRWSTPGRRPPTHRLVRSATRWRAAAWRRDRGRSRRHSRAAWFPCWGVSAGSYCAVGWCSTDVCRYGGRPRAGCGLRKSGPHAIGPFAQLGEGRHVIGLGEDRADDRGEGFSRARRHEHEQVAHEMEAAALPRGAGEDGADRLRSMAALDCEWRRDLRLGDVLSGASATDREVMVTQTPNYWLSARFSCVGATPHPLSPPR